jgi:hypothetical protein
MEIIPLSAVKAGADIHNQQIVTYAEKVRGTGNNETEGLIGFNGRFNGLEQFMANVCSCFGCFNTS